MTACSIGRGSLLGLLLVCSLPAASATPASDRPSAPASKAALPDPVPCKGCWHPAPGTSWQLQFQGELDRTVDADMYDIDMFDSRAAVVQDLHDDGRVVVCYISAGSWERWRPDADRFPESVLGRKLAGWPGERWLDIRRLDILGPILIDRMNMCARRGFDGVDFDNVNGYVNPTGFRLTAKHQLRFNVWLANQAHRRGLSVGLKNDLEQIPELVRYFDFAVVEQCFQYRECYLAKPFIEAGKAVFEVEYELERKEFCPKARRLQFDAMRKRYELDAWRRPCP